MSATTFLQNVGINELIFDVDVTCELRLQLLRYNYFDTI